MRNGWAIAFDAGAEVGSIGRGWFHRCLRRCFLPPTVFEEMTMFAAFIGGWELLLIALVLGVMVGVPLIVVAIVLFVVNRRKNAAPPALQEQHRR